MPRPLKPRDPETGEMVEDDVPPGENGTKPTKHGLERVNLSTKLARERHRRLLLQNEKLRSEMAARQGGLVPLETIQRQVIAANHVVKSRLLSLPDRLAGDLSVMTNPAAIRTLLREAIMTELNELAYEHGTT
jgi:hypothetical protein